MRARCIGLALLLLALAPAAARAQGGTVRVYQATFNELASRIQPLTMSGRYRLQFTAQTWLGPVTWTVCDSAWSATVTQLSFSITPGAATLNGRVDATWCNLAFNSNLAMNVDVRYEPQQKLVYVSTSPTAIQPRFNVLGQNIALPFTIDVAPSLTLPPIPVVTGLVYFETSRGIVDLRVSPQNVTLSKRNGYVEIQGDVSVW
ncbi:MAG TPA: hypothetical protein VID04_02820 [Methylomirabilota bacterium]|jgi:hypothetical protein